MKIEELRSVVKETNADIFAIQETKMICTDKDPNFPGYTIVRKDRWQTRGSKYCRGGGLMLGIKKKVPFGRVTNDIRGKEDDITEWQTIEIPLKGNKDGQKI